MSQQIIAHIDEEELVNLAMGMTGFKSFSGYEKDAAEYIAAEMDRMGYDEVELLEVEKDRPNVVGRIKGKGEGPSFMFNGHIDIDPVPMGHKVDPWDIHVEGRRLYGHGLNNMKGGVTSMIIAGAAIKRAKIQLKGDLTVAAVVGELQGGVGTVDLIKRGIISDYAIVPEPTMLYIRTVHAGVCQFLIHTIGKACWAGSIHKYKNVNAVEKMCKVIKALNEMKLTYTPRPDLPELPRKIITNIMGGLTKEYIMWRPSYVPDYCTLNIDVRTLPGQSIEDVKADIERTLENLKKDDLDFQYELEPPPAIYRAPWRGMKYEMPPLDLPINHKLVEIVSKNHKAVTGEDPPGIGFYDPGSYAGADSGHLFKAGCKCLNYGPTGHNIWDPSVDIDMLLTCSKVLALSAYDILSK